MPETIRRIARDGRKPYGSIAVLTAFIVATAMLCAAGTAMVLGQPATPQEAAARLDLRISEGKVSGGFDKRPLFEILDALRSHASFEYEGDEDSLDHPVSGKFDRLPLTEAVTQILEPTNYTIVIDSAGMIRSLRIGSLRRGAVEAAAGTRPRDTGLGAAVAKSRTEPELTGEGRVLFETAADREVPSPASLDGFEPGRDGSEETGPRVPPDTIVEELPEFAPLVNEDGPFDPDAAHQQLPEFEPLDSDTGPPRERVEDNALSPATPR